MRQSPLYSSQHASSSPFISSGVSFRHAIARQLFSSYFFLVAIFWWVNIILMVVVGLNFSMTFSCLCHRLTCDAYIAFQAIARVLPSAQISSFFHSFSGVNYAIIDTAYTCYLSFSPAALPRDSHAYFSLSFSARPASAAHSQSYATCITTLIKALFHTLALEQDCRQQIRWIYASPFRWRLLRSPMDDEWALHFRSVSAAYLPSRFAALAGRSFRCRYLFDIPWKL